MIAGDYTERKRKARSGKIVIDKIVKSTTGVEYAIGKKFDAGGVARVFRARRLSDKKECVFKEYVPSPEARRMHSAIKKNIQNLMRNPLTEDDGVTPLHSFIGPMDKDSLIELPASKSFGYVMELVDTKAFLPVPKLWHHDRYPDADILCKACANIAQLFKRVHFKGWCYKDINEGNIYINNKTGDIRIIDCDNISVQSSKTIKGTDGFMAPEVYVTSTPDTYTDYFSMAVLFYRLFVGGFPMDGKKTRSFLINSNLSVGEAAATIYGTMALFAFDPKDKSNEIRGLTDPLNPDLYAIQTKRWNRLPPEIQNGFIRTFSTGLTNSNRHKRATDRDWIKIFDNLQSHGLVRCRCGRVNFGDTQRKVECIFCKAKLPLLKPVTSPSHQPTPKPTPKPVPKSIPKPTPSPTSKKFSFTSAATSELTTVVFKAKRDIAPTHLSIEAKRKQQLQGQAIYPGLNEGWMRIEYSKKRNLLSAVNLSRHTWIVSGAPCAPGERVVIKEGLVITVLRRQLQLTVVEIK